MRDCRSRIYMLILSRLSLRFTHRGGTRTYFRQGPLSERMQLPPESSQVQSPPKKVGMFSMSIISDKV